MSSQMFWLLSYVSLGLALTLGNRATNIRASSSSLAQQQKQQTASSSQNLESRQMDRLTWQDTNKNNLLIGETATPRNEHDNIRSYAYNDFSTDDDMNLRRAISSSNSNNNNNNNNNNNDDRTNNDNSFLDEFSIAVLDKLYKRNRDLGVADKSSNARRTNEINIFGNYDDEALPRLPRLMKKMRTTRTTRDYTKKITKSPIVIYRPDRTLEPSLTFNGERIFNERARILLSSRIPGIVDLRNSGEWSDGSDNDENDISPSARSDHLTKRRDNDIDDPCVVNDVDRTKKAGKRNDNGRGRNVKTKDRGGWTGNGQQSQATTSNVPGASIASQFLLRSARGNRQYDVPQIECPASEDGMERFACPTPDRMGRYRCIDDHVLCDGFIDCPTAEDEDRQACMFYKTTKAHLDVLADALLRWARGR